MKLDGIKLVVECRRYIRKASPVRAGVAFLFILNPRIFLIPEFHVRTNGLLSGRELEPDRLSRYN